MPTEGVPLDPCPLLLCKVQLVMVLVHLSLVDWGYSDVLSELVTRRPAIARSVTRKYLEVGGGYSG